MFRAIVLFAVVFVVAAFSPISKISRSNVLKMSFESEIGSQAPLGFWDPLGLLEKADEERFARLREVETKV